MMTDMAAIKTVGMGIAGGAIAAALLDHLVAARLISPDDRQKVLEDAMYRAAMYTGTYEGHAATKIIEELLNADAPAEQAGA